MKNKNRENAEKLFQPIVRQHHSEQGGFHKHP